MVPFAELMAEAKQTVWLSSCIHMSASHSILFKVLSQRTNDDVIAKEFVALKSQRRSLEENTPRRSLDGSPDNK